MTEKLLRDSLTEAKSKGEVGLFIWANWPNYETAGKVTALPL